MMKTMRELAEKIALPDCFCIRDVLEREAPAIVLQMIGEALSDEFVLTISKRAMCLHCGPTILADRPIDCDPLAFIRRHKYQRQPEDKRPDDKQPNDKRTAEQLADEAGLIIPLFISGCGEQLESSRKALVELKRRAAAAEEKP